MNIRTVIRKWHPFTWLSIAVGCIAVCYVLARAAHGEIDRRRDATRRCRVLLTEIAKAKVLYAELISRSDDVVMPWSFLGEASHHFNFDPKHWPCRAEGKVSAGTLSMPVRCERHGVIEKTEMPTSPSTRTQ